MKRLVDSVDFSDVFSRTNLVPRRTGLKCNLWVDDSDCSRHAKHSVPRVKITEGDNEISVSISSTPQILAKTKNIPHNVVKYMEQAIQYVAKTTICFLNVTTAMEWSTTLWIFSRILGLEAILRSTIVQHGRMTERLNVTVLKTVDPKGSLGSNPSPSATS